MKKLFLLIPLLVSCSIELGTSSSLSSSSYYSQDISISQTSSSTSSNESIANSEVVSTESIQSNEETNDFNVESLNGQYSLENNTLKLLTSYAEYTISGYFQGSIVVPENVIKINLNLNNAHIYAENTSAISYLANSKSITIKSLKDTVNTIEDKYTSTPSTMPGLIDSKNNLYFTGSGTLNLKSTKAHCIEGSNVSVKNTQLYLSTIDTCDGISAKSFALLYDIDVNNNIVNNTKIVFASADEGINVKKNTSLRKGTIQLFGGTLEFQKVSKGLQAEDSITIGKSGMWDDVSYNPDQVTLIKGNLDTQSLLAAPNQNIDQNYLTIK